MCQEARARVPPTFIISRAERPFGRRLKGGKSTAMPSRVFPTMVAHHLSYEEVGTSPRNNSVGGIVKIPPRANYSCRKVGSYKHLKFVFSAAPAWTTVAIHYTSGEVREQPSESMLAEGQLLQDSALTLEFWFWVSKCGYKSCQLSLFTNRKLLFVVSKKIDA